MDPDSEPMKVVAPYGLHYPIIITELVKQEGDDVARSTPLFNYHYESEVTEKNRYDEEKVVKRKFYATFDAPVNGVIEKWHLKTFDVVSKPGTLILEVREPCTHEEQFGGLCTNCGMDMTKVDYLTERLESSRATVNMTHDNTALLVSHKEARKAEEASKNRLLEAKKLTLIVDLDQTVIHTTCERTIAEWKEDKNNPNYEFVKDVEGFQLADDNVSHVAANWYYVKKRPGLREFFENMAQFYEMHIYTMATRAYAQEVAKIIDPDRKYFGDRILSRDENGTDKAKSLRRLFPNNPGMVVIIDDRADVWSYSPYLVRVPVFNFFPGAGDINASFLPKQIELPSAIPKKKTEEKGDTKKSAASDKGPYSVTGKPLPSKSAASAEATNGVENDLEQQMINMAAGESEEALEERVKEQEKIIVAQQTERPLLQQQLTLEKEEEEEEAAKSNTPEKGNSPSSEHHKHRAILNNDDNGLEIVENNLRRVYEEFYEEYERSIVKPRGSRVAELKGEKSPRKPRLEVIVPDIADVMPRIKSEALAGCVICFSGIIPLGTDVETSDLALWVKSFGASITVNVDKHTTHVVANADRKTSKVKKAARILHEGGNMQIVTLQWLIDCCTRWEHVEEESYYIDVSDERGTPIPVEELEEEEDEESIDSTDNKNEQSPTSILDLADDDWAAIAKEMEEFNTDSDSEGSRVSDSDSVLSTNSTQSDANGTKPARRKRKRGTESGSESETTGDSDSSVKSTSRLQKRKKRTMERVTSLTNVVNADKQSSGLPSPETTGPEEEQGDEFDPQGGGNDLADDLDQDLEDDMLAEFNAGFDDE
ncbi:hypothetical protein BU23DRAFT_549117 [Bimuria novae-zelandiae CBS 107.79]|uniref:RNA polymerase II subunit A C-terminal domain phosphatase n=1 Tax=Bimuria novae-zelandiae CBS 107.79 TaxID=1447943 RepID=A0A6A5VTP2_9PLEO|nr:hypothetical protein BU23DRAFT_549117 [Bimuria novae-zelandiae CBS 107.79]